MLSLFMSRCITPWECKYSNAFKHDLLIYAIWSSFSLQYKSKYVSLVKSKHILVNQGGLTQKDIKLNLHNIFSTLIIKLYLCKRWFLIKKKLDRAVISIKYLDKEVYLIFFTENFDLQNNAILCTKMVSSFTARRKWAKDILPLIGQKGKSQNEGYKKTKDGKFSEKRTFLPPSVRIRG